jgi:hypothetical protein
MHKSLELLALSLCLVVTSCASTLPPGGSFVAPFDAQGSGDASVSTGDGTASPDTPGQSDVAGADAKTDAKIDAKSDAVAPKPDAGPTPGPVSASCLDGQYVEALPDPKADISSLVQGFQKADALAFVLAVLEVRYPNGRFILDGGNKNVLPGNQQTCLQQFWQPSQGTSAKSALGQASTLVHECGHAYDLSLGGFTGSTYVLTTEVQFTCKGLSYQGQNSGFPRSLLKSDEFSALWPPCANFGDPGECDSYAAIYLAGDPKDNQFDSGDQAFDTVLEETVQYVNSLATDWTLTDQSQFQVSAEDGLLTFLWYTERYLHMARLQYPKVYTYLSTNPCWRESVLTVWGRAWLYLGKSKSEPKLNLRGPMLRKLVTDPVLLDEIERLRQAQGCQ